MAVERDKVVAKNRPRTAGNGAGRALREISFVSINAVLGRHSRTHHFQCVELGRNLEHRTCVGWIGM